jgi:hypothetical protein
MNEILYTLPKEYFYWILLLTFVYYFGTDCLVWPSPLEHLHIIRVGYNDGKLLNELFQEKYKSLNN